MRHTLLLLLGLVTSIWADSRPDPLIPPKINSALSALKTGMKQEQLIARVQEFYPEAYISMSVGGLVNRNITIHLNRSNNVRFDLSMSVTRGHQGWELKEERFTIGDWKLKTWTVLDRSPIQFVESTQSSGKDNQAEQGGAGEPATRAESDSKGSDKPQPEAEGRSR